MRIELETEVDGRFIAEVPDIPGALEYGDTAHEAIRRVESLVQEVRRLKEENAADYGFNIRAIGASARRHQEDHPERIVSRESKIHNNTLDPNASPAAGSSLRYNSPITIKSELALGQE